MKLFNVMCCSVMNLRIAVFLLILSNILFVKISEAQDIHYSQFYNPELILNPAKTGIFNGDVRILGSFRDQWESVQVPWMTFSASYDQKIYPKNSDSHFFAGGINFNYDKQGDSELNLTNLNLFGSMTLIVNEHNLFTLGLGLGFASRGFDRTSLTWDQQWNGQVFDPSLPTGEAFDADRISFFENAIGVNYRWQKSSRTKIDAGIGVYHALEPKVAFFSNDDIKLPRRYTGSISGNFQLVDALDIQIHTLSQFQDDYWEFIGGGLLKFYIDQQRGKEFELHLGVGYRTSKSLFPTVAIQYKNIYVSFNYDVDLSDFTIATNNKGGPELHFRYIITRVKPLKHFKICPIF